ncbi:MAG TPA: hypothetical protein VLW55_22800 [Burkholderiaceae bacterium]|nr:hypothetical protein [Burkholderiaceae bacterium]
MTAHVMAAIVFICVSAGALGGVALRARVPDHDLDTDLREGMKLVLGLVSTVTGMVLGLMVNSSNSLLNTQDSEVQQLSAQFVELDHRLAHYGPETKEIRAMLREVVAAEIERLWQPGTAASADLAQAPTTSEGDDVYAKILALKPQSDAQRFAQSRALQSVTEMAHVRLLMHEQASEAIPWPFLVILVFWLVALFAGFGILSRGNAMGVTTLFVGALIVSGALFLIVDMRHGYTGLIQISSAPMQRALAQIGR